MLPLILGMLYTLIVFFVTTFLIAKCVNCAIPPKSKLCLIGKTGIVTGANRGIGLELALVLAMRGCRVIIACRRNLEQTRQRIIKETNNPNIVAIHLDLLSLESVRAFAKQVNETEEKLDILIHNAMLLKAPLNFTADGLNPIMQVSHFGPFLLTNLLVDLMKKSAAGRIVFVSSFFAYLHNLRLDNLNPPYVHLNADVMGLYTRSKVCNIISAIGFAERLKKYGITVNAVHPGLIHTSIYEAAVTPEDSLINKVFYVFFVVPVSKSVEKAVYAIISTIADDKYKNTTGEFLFDLGKVFMPLGARNPEFCRQIWNATEDYLKLKPEERLQ